MEARTVPASWPWLVRLLQPDGRPAGAGFLVDEHHVLTCAHVIRGVLGAEAPAGELNLDLPSRPDLGKVTARIEVGGWFPVEPDEGGDIAVLTLSTPMTGVEAAVVSVPWDTTDHRVRCRGFTKRHPTGEISLGVVLGRGGPRDQWVQVDARSSRGFAVGMGFSGTPVWDEDVGAVVGMVTAADPDREVRVSWMIPIEIIAQYWKPLADLLQPQDGISPEDGNRRTMLERVRLNWIRGFLDQSLNPELQIEVTRRELSAAVVQPMGPRVRHPARSPGPLVRAEPIGVVFATLGRALLILGAPGSGKTILMLELARHLLERAERDPKEPMPVVFTLSSWAVRRAPLADWLVDELDARYQVTRKIGQGWIDTEQVLPLLDGLDEVAPEHREGCVAAINAFREEHGFLPMAVSCRSDEYGALPERLRLLGGIELQPLAKAQVRACFNKAGRPLAGVRAVLRDDPVLWELLKSPLLLTIVALAYRDKPASEVRASGTPADRRRHLFTAYIDAMFERRSQDPRYPRPRTIAWLAWLGRSLLSHNQTEFYLERMQPDWLPARSQQRVVTVGTAVAVGLFTPLLFVLSGQLITATLVALHLRPPVEPPANLTTEALYVGATLLVLALGLFVGLPAAMLGYSRAIEPVEDVRWSWSAVRDRLYSAAQRGLLVGLPAGALVGLFFGPLVAVLVVVPWLIVPMHGPLGRLLIGLVGGLFVGLLNGLLYRLISGLLLGKLGYPRTTGLAANVRSWQSAIRDRLRSAAIGGLISGLICGLVLWPYGFLAIDLLEGTLYGVLVGLLVGKLGSLSASEQAAKGRWSWSAVRYRLRSAVRPGLHIGLRTGLVAALVFGLVLGFAPPPGGPHVALLLGLLGVLLGGPLGALLGALVGLVTGLLVIGPLYGLLGGVAVGQLTATPSMPNEGMRRSLRNALTTMVLFGLFGGLLALPAGLRFGTPVFDFLLGVATLIGLLAGLRSGGRACLQHLVLRALLVREGHAPWQLARFLDYATERLLLRKVGGGYIFIHRLLLEHFASLA